MKRTTFNQAFKQAMDESGVKPSQLAELAGRSRTNISQIRNGENSPSIGDFCELIGYCDQIRPGFSDLFGRILIGETRRQSLKPEELINSLEPAEIGAILLALGTKMSESKMSEKKELLLTA
jgi:transcriptional regulator with XRE-family HTH domain